MKSYKLISFFLLSFFVLFVVKAAYAASYNHQWYTYYKNGRSYSAVSVYNNGNRDIKCNVYIQTIVYFDNKSSIRGMNTHTGIIRPGQSRRTASAAYGQSYNYKINCWDR